ncbi:CLUMA_CG016264, isoform A [Clunio marinus]|uniref:CLUMA_CG016264, isoform A n=1 Tax=Clunio marinus TaxID=568069 RepID=A0A1J1IU58_9DIPT|nr:CLUMA_CG016264, isoform A [Clunio marinus]
MGEIRSKNLNFPFDFKELDDDLQEEVSLKFPNQPEMIFVGPEKWFLPKSFKDYANIIYNFDVRPSDVFVCTFPRSGTTWTQEMVWLICNDLDYNTAKQVALTKRFPYIENHLVTSEKAAKEMSHISGNIKNLENVFAPIYDVLESQTTQRFIKTHLPIEFLPWKIKQVGAKVVYVARNPKDAAVSFFHFQQNPWFRYNENFEHYAEYFMKDLVMYSPYWDHVASGWKHKDDQNVHFVFYENFKLNMKQSLINLAEFLGKPLKDEDLPGLMKHLDFENAKKNPAFNFGNIMLRQGSVGGNSEISGEVERKFDEWIEQGLKTSATREMAIINKKFLSETNAEIDIQTYDPIDKVLEAQTTQRFIKIHLPMQFLLWKIKEVGAKVVYVARNPKDVAVSYFHFEKNPIFAYNGDFETYSDFFMNDQVIYAPYWKHVLDGWKHRHESNFHFMFYEDLKLNTEESLRKLSKFLEKPLKDEDLPKLLDHLNFDNAKENLAVNAVNLMLRKGCIGGNSEMTEEISANFDKWTEENLRESDLKFPVKFT